jgi:hypothetical protein
MPTRPSPPALWLSSIVASIALMSGAAVRSEADDKRQVPAVADAATVFAGADLAEGSELIERHQCTACHVRNVGGDGHAIYRPQGRINTPGFLRGMVEYCNTELKLQLFPEEVTSIGAVLNRDHYRFK